MTITGRRPWRRFVWAAAGVAVTALAAAVLLGWGELATVLPGSATAVWAWVERLSWISGVAALAVALIAVRREADRKTAAARGSDPQPVRTVERVRNIQARNPAFIGRDELIHRVRDGLLIRGSLVVHALHGWGGVGKTQLAVEYAHRHAEDYDVIWWFAAEQPELLADQYRRLAVAAGIASPETETEVAVLQARRLLSERSRWLVVFDNAEDPAVLRPWIPAGPGHVLVTSRRSDWGELGTPIAVDTFSRTESMALLGQGTGMAEADARDLAGELGDLPLALVQAAGFIAETGMPVANYLSELDQRANQVLAEGRPPSYPMSLAATVTVALSRANTTDRAAGQLLQIAASLGPEPVPLRLFTDAPTGTLPAPLAGVASRPLSLRRSVGLLVRLGLVRLSDNGIQLHRLTRAVVVSAASEQTRRAGRRRAEAVLTAAQPAHTDDPDCWPAWSELAPHLLALDPAGSAERPVRDMAARWVRSLLKGGAITEGQRFAEQFHAAWHQAHGQEDLTVLEAAFLLGYAFYLTGRWDDARQVNEQSWIMRLRLLGPDHHDTLDAANNHAGNLVRSGDVEAGRALYREVFDRRRRLLGEDHPDTLMSAGNLATELRSAGDAPAALQLHHATWQRRRRLNGPDHLDTLNSARNVAIDLREMGELDEALALFAQTAESMQRVLGPDHWETLRCRFDWGLTLRRAGQKAESRRVLEDVAARRQRVLGEDHPYTRESLRALKGGSEESSDCKS